MKTESTSVAVWVWDCSVLSAKEYKGVFWGDGNVYLDYAKRYTAYPFIKAHWTVHFKWVGFFPKIFFLMWTIFKIFIEFITILLLFYVLVFWPWGMWDFSLPTRDRTHILCTGRQSLNHWTTREVPVELMFYRGAEEGNWRRQEEADRLIRAWGKGRSGMHKPPWSFAHGKDCASIQFSRSVMSNSLQLHELQHTRIPCPSPTPGACSNTCPSSRWCHPAISTSVITFSSCLQSLPASGSLPMSQFFTSGGQSIGASASASVLPMNIQDWFPSGLTGLSPCSPRDSQEFSPTPQFKSINSLALSFLYGPTLTSTHDYWKNHSFD